MSDLAVSVEHVREHGVLVVNPIGQLTKHNRWRLRAAVMKCIAECPIAVVVDLADITLVDRVAGAVFLALRREAASGPGINLLISGAERDLALRIRSLDRTQPMYPTRAAAIQAINDSPFVEDWVYRRLPPAAASVSMAGCLIADACAAWQLPHMIHSARAAMFDLFRTVHRCTADDLQIIAARRPGHLRISLRSGVATGHRPDCVMGRQPLRTVSLDAGAGPATATYRHTVKATGHIVWVSLRTDTAGA